MKKINKEALLTEEFKSLVISMLHKTPEERPSIEEIKNHPWMKGKMPTKKELENQKTVINQLKEQILENERKCILSKVESKKKIIKENLGNFIKEKMAPSTPFQKMMMTLKLKAYVEIYARTHKGTGFESSASLADIQEELV